MSYTELEKQPFWWVNQMLSYLSIKCKYEEIENKRIENRSKYSNTRRK
jgi:hypothetical protein